MPIKRKATKKRNKQPEHELQCAFFEWLALKHPSIRKTTFAIPNGARVSLRQAVGLVKAGLTKGCPDIFIATPRSIYHGLFIEFKSPKGVTSFDQEIFIDNLLANNYLCKIIRNIDDAIKVVEEYVRCT